MMESRRRTKQCVPSFDVTAIPLSIEAVTGRPMTISLRVRGNPRPQVRWQIGRRKVKEATNKYHVDQNDQGLCTLIVYRCSKMLEEGVWAIATNDLGEDCCMVEVKVKEEDTFYDENDMPAFNSKRTEGNTRIQQLSHRRENKIETENNPVKPNVCFGLGAKQKRNFSLSKSFEIDESTNVKKPSKIDRSMIGEFNFFHEAPPKKFNDYTKNLEEIASASSIHSRTFHKPPPLPARFKNDSKSHAKNDQERRRTHQNRWKKGAFSSHNFVATSSEVELNDEDDDEEPIEAVRVTKRKRKPRISSVNASFESSRSSVNSVCLETNFDDCVPKLTVEKYSWQPETNFSSKPVSNAPTSSDKLKQEVNEQTNRLPTIHQGNAEEWKMDGVKINRICHDMLSAMPEIELIDYHKINKTGEGGGTREGTPSSSCRSDFEMEMYSASPKRRKSPDSSLIKPSNENLSVAKNSNALKELSDQEGSQGEPKVEVITRSSNRVSIRESLTAEEEGEEEKEEKTVDVSEESSSSSSSDHDEDEDDDEDEHDDEKDDKVEESMTEETEKIVKDEERQEVTTDEENVEVDESTHSSSSEVENELENETESMIKETESQEISSEQETSDESGEEIKTNSSDTNNDDNDDNNDDVDDDDDDSSNVKSTPLQFIDSDGSDEEWPAPPSAEILNSLFSLHSPNLVSNNIINNINNNNSNNINIQNTSYIDNEIHKVIPIKIRLSPNKNNNKENEEHVTQTTAKNQPSKVEFKRFKTHKDSTALPAYNANQRQKSPTYRDAIMERTGSYGVTNTLIGLRGFNTQSAYKKVAFKFDQNDGRDEENEAVTEHKPINPQGRATSPANFEPPIDNELVDRTTFSRDKAMFLSSVTQTQSKEATPHVNHAEEKLKDDKIERRSVEKKSVRFLEDDSSENVVQGRRTFVKPFQSQTQTYKSSFDSHAPARWHDLARKHFFPSDESSQINGEKQTKRFAFDERDGRKDSFEDGTTSPVTTHEYGELISFTKRHDGLYNGKTMEELTEQTINEVVTNKCSVREAVKNILKNRADRRSPNLWSYDSDRARLPRNLESRLENYPMFLSDSGFETRRFGRVTQPSGTQHKPGISNVNMPEPHFI